MSAFGRDFVRDMFVKYILKQSKKKDDEFILFAINQFVVCL